MFRVFFFLLSFLSNFLFSHCEIPCGIYHDHFRIHLIEEHIQTIEKAMIFLRDHRGVEQEQVIRWVMNKEKHAQKIQDIVAHYFLHQRIKPVDRSDQKKWNHYHENLEVLHKILFYSMKAKQTIDLSNVRRLRILLKQFDKLYF